MFAALFASLSASPLVRTLLKWGLIILGALAALLWFRRTAEKAGRAAERLEAMTHVAKTQQKMEAAAKSSPSDRAGLTDRLRNRRRPF